MKIARLNRYTLAFAHDTAMALCAFVLALALRLNADFTALPIVAVAISAVLFTATCAIVFSLCGLYRSVWAFTSMADLLKIVRAVTIAVVTYVVVAFLLMRLAGTPRTVPFITWFILIAGLSGSRVFFRLLRERRLSTLWERSGSGRVNVLLVGAGDEADVFMRALSTNPHAPFNVVGILGENDKRVGRSIHGVQVLGKIEDISTVIDKLRARNQAPSRIILTRAVARFNGALTAHLLEQSAALGLTLSRVPALTELRNDISASTQLRDQPIVLEDLLGRPETKLNRQEIRALVKGRRVLVTGAGGSIGGEIVRQIAALEPKNLIILDACEYNLYRIEMEIKESLPYQPLKSILADVRDTVRIDRLFNAEKPELVFHAAAIKHVPIAEENVRETVLTNVLGTRIVADCAAKYGVIAMVMISTDKAVYPSSVMGATKRLAEMYCQALDLASATSRFITVRFGNVLGSTGSVVPRFQEQIAKGGPVTVTHPDMTRYFMTIREAVELVLQASTLGVQPGDQRGKVLVLDMGQPVKIVDLARQMIRLAGLRPDDDIKITFTGLRPGEKMHEELFADAEEHIPSAADGVKLAKSTTIDMAVLRSSLDALSTEIKLEANESAAVATLCQLVPEYKGQCYLTASTDAPVAEKKLAGNA